MMMLSTLLSMMFVDFLARIAKALDVDFFLLSCRTHRILQLNLPIILFLDFPLNPYFTVSHPANIDLNKKWLPKQKTIQNCNINSQGFRKQEMKMLPRGK